MARYTGPVCRLCRRLEGKLFLKGERCLSPRCAVERHNSAPGQQPGRSRRRKVSERGLQLREKQRARFTYGILEAQFRRHFGEAERQPGVTGENLLRILERRMDNVVFRLGFADSRNQARQLVTHGHFTVNGRKVSVASFQVKSGDVVAVAETSRKLEYFKDLSRDMRRKAAPGWLGVEAEALAGRVLALPSRQDIDVSLSEQAIVEYYSR